MNYGDAIQVLPWLIGGRVGSKKRPFEFTYHIGGERSNCWHLGLHSLDIEDIADGRMTELTLYCCRTPDCGHKTSDPEFLCNCDYENDPYFGHIEVADTVEALSRCGITGISETSTKAQIILALGPPKESGCDSYGDAFDHVPPWIKYERNHCQFHFQFDGSGRLRKLTIMEADWKPGI